MRKAHRLAAGLIVAAALAACTSPSKHISTAATLAPSTTGAAMPQKTLCAQVEGVTGLASDLNTALAARNFSDAKSVIARAAALAQSFANNAPSTVKTDATTVSSAYQTNATTVSTADPSSPQGATTVQTVSGNIKTLYSAPQLANLDAYRRSHCP